MSMRTGIINLGLKTFGATGLHRVAARYTQGLGAILMFHRVCIPSKSPFQPNSGLEITPAFLDSVLCFLRARRIDIVSMDEAALRIQAPAPDQRPFVALSFDDGYRDTLEKALPILERHAAPFIVHVTTGFADRSARLWWVEMEQAIAALPQIRLYAAGKDFSASSVTPKQKYAAFKSLYWLLRAAPELELLRAIGVLATEAGLDSRDIADSLCLDWAGVKRLSAHPLATIGAHTLTHAMLAKRKRDDVWRELSDSRAIIAREIGRDVRHLAYPVGDPTSAGPREFALAREAGFVTAVTTRPGMAFADHADHLLALPRLSVNGQHQSLAAFEALLSGAPFMLWNRGRKLSVA